MIIFILQVTCLEALQYISMPAEQFLKICSLVCESPSLPNLFNPSIRVFDFPAISFCEWIGFYLHFPEGREAFSASMQDSQTSCPAHLGLCPK